MRPEKRFKMSVYWVPEAQVLTQITVSLTLPAGKLVISMYPLYNKPYLRFYNQVGWDRRCCNDKTEDQLKGKWVNSGYFFSHSKWQTAHNFEIHQLYFPPFRHPVYNKMGLQAQQHISHETMGTSQCKGLGHSVAILSLSLSVSLCPPACVYSLLLQHERHIRHS